MFLKRKGKSTGFRKSECRWPCWSWTCCIRFGWLWITFMRMDLGRDIPHRTSCQKCVVNPMRYQSSCWCQHHTASPSDTFHTCSCSFCTVLLSSGWLLTRITFFTNNTHRCWQMGTISTGCYRACTWRSSRSCNCWAHRREGFPSTWRSKVNEDACNWWLRWRGSLWAHWYGFVTF